MSRAHPPSISPVISLLSIQSSIYSSPSESLIFLAVVARIRTRILVSESYYGIRVVSESYPSRIRVRPDSDTRILVSESRRARLGLGYSTRGTGGGTRERGGMETATGGRAPPGAPGAGFLKPGGSMGGPSDSVTRTVGRTHSIESLPGGPPHAHEDFAASLASIRVHRPAGHESAPLARSDACSCSRAAARVQLLACSCSRQEEERTARCLPRGTGRG